MPGDHGYTYIANGVNLIDDGAKVICSKTENKAKCHDLWLQAEVAEFGPGSPEFCVFAMDVEPLQQGAQPIACELPTKGRFVVGNGKGRPKAGPAIPNISGVAATSYVSTTTLRHTRNGKATYVDSAAIPGLVVPTVPRQRPWHRFEVVI